MALKFGFTISELVKENRVTEENVKLISDWLKTENLPEYNKEMIGLFLMACDNNIDNTKLCAKEYYLSRKNCPELFLDRDLSCVNILKQYNVLELGIMSARTDDGYAVMLGRFQDTNPWSYDMVAANKLFIMAMDSLMYNNPPKGLVLLYDMKGMSLMHMTRINLSVTRRMFHYVQEGLNVQLKAVHVLNVTWLVDKVLKIVKPFLKPELLQLLHLHTSDMKMEEFFEKHVPERCVPADYGGTDAYVAELHKRVWKRLEELEDFFKEEEKLRAID